ncbi:MAG: acyl-CoA dehydratase activase-related protein, partial [Myxococcota bacterium]
TIIEIGGQDAKFTTLRDGVVTLSIMNNVCAAGTGSFIEEQAARLSCPLDEYSGRAMGKAAPLASDRCTVFMERDINHYLAAGYSSGEILATVLHSVRENYMRKVAREQYIGSRICFQGATAKNRALVAAFEQKLQKPIAVSRYCHLTGALGVALMLDRADIEATVKGATRFRGLSLFRDHIAVHSEVCTLCRNNCKLNVATVRAETVAYGMLCGREYSVEKYVSSNRSGFDLLSARRKLFAFEPSKAQFTVRAGIPSALHMHEDMPLWRKFFDLLGVPVVTTEGLRDVVVRGKRLAGAEFCAPIAALHGHVDTLAGKSDFIFMPFYIEESERPRGTRRNYCYYTQFAGSLAATISDPAVRKKLVSPVVNNCESTAKKVASLYGALRPVLGRKLSILKVASAYRQAVNFHRKNRAALPGMMTRELATAKGISVVLLGRPYTVLSPAMNSAIPEIISSMGVKCFYQDMLPAADAAKSAIKPLLDEVHWEYAARTLMAAETVGKMEGVYPILITSFKCAPDSCVIEPLRRILDSHGKPYLILQLDEHDSQTGYETRIEAALRSFGNHHSGRRRKSAKVLPVNPRRVPAMAGRTVLIPNWDRYSCTLMAANMRREGIDAHVLEENDQLIAQGLRHNTGQCIPLNIIVEEFMAYVTKHGLDPAKSAIWIHSSQMGCNIGAFPLTMQSLLETHGNGFEKAGVYVGQISGKDMSIRAIANQYLVFLCAGYLRKMGCRVRPYELDAGETDRVLEESLGFFEKKFESGGDILAAVRSVVDRFVAIKTGPGRRRPLVAFVGDFYVRDNDVMNQSLIKVIEANGGEVLTTAFSDYAKIISDAYLQKWVREGKYVQAGSSRVVLTAVKALEKSYLREFGRVLGPAPKAKIHPMKETLARYGVTEQHTGESLDNLLKIHRLTESHPEIKLIVQLSPAFCCPSLVTEAMSADIQRVTGVPVVTITYDGTRSPKNSAVIPYLNFRTPV